MKVNAANVEPVLMNVPKKLLNWPINFTLKTMLKYAAFNAAYFIAAVFVFFFYYPQCS